MISDYALTQEGNYPDNYGWNDQIEDRNDNQVEDPVTDIIISIRKRVITKPMYFDQGTWATGENFTSPVPIEGLNRFLLAINKQTTKNKNVGLAISGVEPKSYENIVFDMIQKREDLEALMKETNVLLSGLNKPVLTAKYQD